MHVDPQKLPAPGPGIRVEGTAFRLSMNLNISSTVHWKDMIQ